MYFGARSEEKAFFAKRDSRELALFAQRTQISSERRRFAKTNPTATLEGPVRMEGKRPLV
jgi:hypothetical protein